MTGVPYIVGFLAGDDAWMMEDCCDDYDEYYYDDDEYYYDDEDNDDEDYDDRMKDAAMLTLKNMFGVGIPEPEFAKATKWGDDPFSYGAYSYNKAKMDKN